MANYYDVLGILPGASDKEVRQAYRKLAREHHPDVNQGDKASEAKFKQINEAYGVLSDPEKRGKYDKYGDDWTRWEQIEEDERSHRGGTFRWSNMGGQSPNFDFGEGEGAPFETLFANLRRDGHSPPFTQHPPSTEHPIQVSLEEAFHGTTRLLSLPGGRRLEVTIPPGVDSGSRVRVAAEKGRGGDIYLVVTVQPHARFRRKGRDLCAEVEVPLEDAILGGETTVPTLSGNVTLAIPPETQNGQRFRLAGKGMPALKTTSKAPDQRGDLLATVKVRLPTGLNEEQLDWFRRFKESRSDREE